MPQIDVVADANVVLKWFHAEGEEEVEPARSLLTHHRNRQIALHVLDLTSYELGNALLRGRLGVGAERTSVTLAALAEMCPAIAPDPKDRRLACVLAQEHDLTLYDATYAAVAQRRDAILATLDERILNSGLGQRPGELLRTIADSRS